MYAERISSFIHTHSLTHSGMETHMMRRTDLAAFLRGGEILYNNVLYAAAQDLDIWSPLVHHSTRCHALSELRRGLSDWVEYYDGFTVPQEEMGEYRNGLYRCEIMDIDRHKRGDKALFSFPLFLGMVADVTHGKYCKGANMQFFELGIVHPNRYHCVQFPCTPDTLFAMRLVYLLERFLYRFVAGDHSSLKNHVPMHKFRFEVTGEHGPIATRRRMVLADAVMARWTDAKSHEPHIKSKCKWPGDIVAACLGLIVHTLQIPDVTFGFMAIPELIYFAACDHEVLVVSPTVKLEIHKCT